MQPTGYGCDTKPNAVPNAKPIIEAQAKIIMDAALTARDK
jgi:hypothetical protein